MLRAGVIAGISLFLIAATPVPLSNPTRQPEAPVAQQPVKSVKSPNAPETGPQIGNDPNRPIYAKVSCEHGCGYFEDDRSWLQRLWTDPVATFTAALAILTFGLVGAGAWQGYLILRAEKLTRSALLNSQKATRAAIALELPVIRAQPPRLLTVNQFPVDDAPFGGLVCNVIPSHRSVIDQLYVLNGGRTHATPIAISMGWHVGQKLPEKPNYVQRTHSARQAWILQPATRIAAGIDPLCIELTAQQVDGLKAKDLTLWLYARVEYEDFLDTVREARFCWHWTQANGLGLFHFAPARDVPPDYTYKTSIDLAS